MPQSLGRLKPIDGSIMMKEMLTDATFASLYWASHVPLSGRNLMPWICLGRLAIVSASTIHS